MRNSFVTGLFIVILTAYLSSCKGDLSSVTRPLLGTAVTITLAPGTVHTEELFAASFAEIEKVQKELSIYDPGTELSMVNRSAFSRPVKVSSDVFNIIDRALFVSGNTYGAFDITWASAGKLWDFSKDDFIPPDENAVKKVLPLISYRNVRLDAANRTVRFLKHGTLIGLGGIAKGYAVSRATGILRCMNVKGAIVACAGDIQVIGSNNGRPWRVGIRDPRGTSVIGSLDMRDGEAVSTSGDYERFRIVNGKRYHHIINPATGYPAESGLISVSVFSMDPVVSDAYSTAFFVLGLVKAQGLLHNMKDVAVVLVTSDMTVYVSESLKGRIAFRENVEVIYF